MYKNDERRPELLDMCFFGHNVLVLDGNCLKKNENVRDRQLDILT